MIKVSVIIVNYNGIKWLPKCLSTITNQDYKNYEVIVVDNNSSDTSVSYIKDNFKDVKVILNNKNSGFSVANNIGIKNSSGNYILLLNNDTWVHKNFIQSIVSFYTNNNFDVIAPFERNYNPEIPFSPYKKSIDLLGHPIYYKENLDRKKEFYLSGVSLFFSKKLYFDTKGLDDDFFMYFEETDWFWRLNILGKTFSHIPNVFVYHHGAGSTGKGIKYNSFLWRNQNTLQMLLKNYSFITLFLLLPSYFLLNILEMFFFLLILKPKISFSYLQGWYFNLKYISRIYSKRKWIQNNRKISDLKVMKKFYIGSSKFKHLIELI